MADSGTAESGRKKHVRFMLDVHFESKAGKSAFQDNLALVKGLLTLPDHCLDNKEFLLAFPVGPSEDLR